MLCTIPRANLSAGETQPRVEVHHLYRRVTADIEVIASHHIFDHITEIAVGRRQGVRGL